MNRRAEEFQEIAHSGGKITLAIRTDADGRRGYQMQLTHNRPNPSAIIGIYALREGIPVGSIRLGGIGDPWNPPPHPSCIAVLVASDSTGHFGHSCPACKGYWRSGPLVNVCPYCRVEAASHEFLSQAQRRYVQHFCHVLNNALSSDVDGDTVIDMDAVADATDSQGERPAFYVSEESQQRKFKCAACDGFNDILGRFGYCSACGTRNDLADFEIETVTATRERLNAGAVPEDCLRSAVSSFDSVTAQLVKELVRLIPMTERRRNRLMSQRFHNLDELQNALKECLDIDIRGGINDADWRFAIRMFLRRHVYEHNGGEVDQKYIEDSNDVSVRLRQHIHETREDVHTLLGTLQRLVRNLHAGFHELIETVPEPIKMFEDRKALMASHRAGR
jgi:hypothetical protein